MKNCRENISLFQQTDKIQAHDLIQIGIKKCQRQISDFCEMRALFEVLAFQQICQQVLFHFIYHHHHHHYLLSFLLVPDMHSLEIRKYLREKLQAECWLFLWLPFWSVKGKNSCFLSNYKILPSDNRCLGFPTPSSSPILC